jgi:type VI secretion system protein ImpL
MPFLPFTKRIGLGVGLAIFIVVALLILGSRLGWWGEVERWLWWGFLLLVAEGLIVSLLWIVPRYRQRRFLAGIDAPELERKIQEALQTIERAPNIPQQGEQHLYALPWYMLLGVSRSGKTSLLRSVSNAVVPFARPTSATEGPTKDCEWWFFHQGIIIDTSGHYAGFPEGTSDRGEWLQLLRLLRAYRPRQPLNGVMITVAMDTLISKNPDELRHEATALRQRIDELMRELGIVCPVNVLVTQCDLLEGFTDFFDAFPDKTEQAFGYVQKLPPQLVRKTTAVPPVVFEPIMTSQMERLQQLRSTLFNGMHLPPTSSRQRVYCFPEEFRAVQSGLTTFMETLFANSPLQHTPSFRGLFLCSALQQGSPQSFLRQRFRFNGKRPSRQGGSKPYLLRDLFETILWRNPHLATPLGRNTCWQQLQRLLGLGMCLAIALVLFVLLRHSALSDRLLTGTFNGTVCPEIQQVPSGEMNLEAVDRCRREVQTLIDQNRLSSFWSTLVFNRAGQLAQHMRQRYVHLFAHRVLTPLDTAIEQRLLTPAEGVPLAFLLINRIDVLDQCLSITGCPDFSKRALSTEDYRLMLAPRQSASTLPDNRVRQLQQGYEAYLQWSLPSRDVLRHEQEAHAVRLRRWFSPERFASEEIMAWANQMYADASATLADYWHWHEISATGHGGVRVDGAFTPKAWQQSIQPFLRRSREAVPDMAPLLEDFKNHYQRTYFEQWQHFVAFFPRGEEPWLKSRERRRQLAMMLVDDQSPYMHITMDAFTNLMPFLPAVLVEEGITTATANDAPFWKTLWQKTVRGGGALLQKIGLGKAKDAAIVAAEETLPAWVRVLRRYLVSEQRQQYRGLLRSIDAVNDKTSLEQSFELAKAGFEQKKPSDQATQPILKAWWQITQFRQKVGTGDTTEEIVWTLLERPLRVIWHMILEQTAAFMQQSWTEHVVIPTKGFSPVRQLEFLYGSQGVVNEFIDRFVNPFLTANRMELRTVLDESVPLSPAFLEMLREQRQLRALLAGQQDHAATVAATGKSLITTSSTNMIEDKTEFHLDCGSKKFTVSNQPPGVTTVQWGFQNCHEVLITVFVSCNRTCVERAADVGTHVPEGIALPLIKRYTGQAAFLDFVEDFRNGQRTFQHAELEDPKDAMPTYSIRAVTVFYRIGSQAPLRELLSLMRTSLVVPRIVQ